MFFSIIGRTSVWILLRRTDFAYIYLFTAKSDRIQCPIVTGHNFRNYSQTEIKERQKNLTINGKNYRNGRRLSYCYFGNDEHWRRNKYTNDFDARTLIGLTLKKHIEFRENWEAENYSGPSANIPNLNWRCDCTARANSDIYDWLVYFIKTCEAGLVLSVTRILRAIPCVCLCVCMYVCMYVIKLLPNHWTDLHKNYTSK